ncbi:MAG: family 10 glycosylhydrolase [Pleurocapsa sp.]
MLKNALHWQQTSSKLSALVEFKTNKYLKLISTVLPLIIFTTPAIAAESILGVVKSQENIGQWSEIRNRLRRVGIQYCIVDSSSWTEELDLGQTGVLLLPNVEVLNAAQVQALQQWMNKGGKIIVTGPTGNSSQPEIRDRLRSLLGAYWGYALSSASTLELTDTTPTEWFGRTELSRTFFGGALIPSEPNSQTAAMWIGEGEKPAAVVTDNSTFLGWRWGFDRVAPASLDSSWLQAALNRYGISTYGKFSPVANVESSAPCRPNVPESEESRPFVPNLQSLLDNSQSLKTRLSVDFHREPPLSRQEVTSMTQELEGLIGRFETTLLTANASQSNIDISTSEVIQQLLSRKTKKNEKRDDKKSLEIEIDKQSSANRALQEARDGLKQFLYSVERQNYREAKQQWSAAKKTLWDNYPTNGQLAQSEVRAMWLDRGTIVKTRSESDLAEIFDRMVSAGINTVFFETLNSGYTIYPSHVSPQQNPLVRGWDPLEAAVKLAHERGMELHAWVWTFAAVNRRHNIILNRPRNHLGPVLSRHPDWAITDQNGNRFHYNSGKVFFDPANPGVRRYLSLLLKEIATEYKVDGIHLDYIRYPFQDPSEKLTYGYGIAARQQFRQMTGVDPIQLTPQDPLWSQWIQFRSEQIDSFISSVSQELKQQRPDLILSTAVFPMPRSERLYKIQQDWEEWVKQEWIDLLVPMTYAPDTEKLNQLASPLLREFSKSKTLLLPGIRLLDLSDVMAVDQMQLLRGMSTEGYALFAAENLNSNLETLLNRIQGNPEAKTTEPLPYRQPFHTTLHRYQSLQKEWNFFLSNNQLSVEEVTLKEWGERADGLGEDLQKLADDPSVKHFLSTQLALSSFRRQFPKWMKETKSIDSYQAKIWQNRLNTLDRLLSYGEKRILPQNNKTSLNISKFN